jgi:hypothetical protein
VLNDLLTIECEEKGLNSILSFIFVSSGSMIAVDRVTTWTQRLLFSSVTYSGKLKGKDLLVTRHGGSRGITPLILNPCARYWWVLNATLRPFHLVERAPAPIIQEDGWAPWQVWTGMQKNKFFEASWFRNPNRPTRKDLQYQLRYSCPQKQIKVT